MTRVKLTIVLTVTYGGVVTLSMCRAAADCGTIIKSVCVRHVIAPDKSDELALSMYISFIENARREGDMVMF